MGLSGLYQLPPLLFMVADLLKNARYSCCIGDPSIHPIRVFRYITFYCFIMYYLASAAVCRNHSLTVAKVRTLTQSRVCPFIHISAANKYRTILKPAQFVCIQLVHHSDTKWKDSKKSSR